MLCCYGYSTDVIIPFSSFQLFSRTVFTWHGVAAPNRVSWSMINKQKKKKRKRRKQSKRKGWKKILLLGLITTSRHTGEPCLADCIGWAIGERLGLLGWNSRRGLSTAHPSFPRLPSLACQDGGSVRRGRTLLADRLRTRSFCSSSLLSIRSQALAEKCVL